MEFRLIISAKRLPLDLLYVCGWGILGGATFDIDKEKGRRGKYSSGISSGDVDLTEFESELLWAQRQQLYFQSWHSELSVEPCRSKVMTPAAAPGLI